MKFIKIILISLFIIPAVSSAQKITLPNILSGNKSGSGISENEAGQGIKEALSQGVTNAVLNLNKTDGFFGSEFYKMLLPEDVAQLVLAIVQLHPRAHVPEIVIKPLVQEWM